MLADMKQIHDFAVKWCDKFKEHSTDYLELVDHWMADDCHALGFVMDCGHAFSEKYGNAANNHASLEKIIHEVTDIPLLGSAIYSRWRYFNHWAYMASEILEPENRTWFILALTRLAVLSGDNPFIFQGTLEKVRILSNNIRYGPMPKPDEEVEQHLTINSEGRVRFSGYNFGTGGGRYESARRRNFKIEKAATNKLFDAIAAYFGNAHTEVFAADSGDWVMELTNTEGVTYKFRGSLCDHLDCKGTDLSDLVRDTVGMDDLYVFDGNSEPDVITKITLDYRRVTKITPHKKPEGADWESVTWDYTERLVIGRETETLEHIQNVGTRCIISHKYEVEGGIESLLENFDAEDLFSHIEGNPHDVLDTPNETKDYTITIEYRKKPSRIITGSYDKNGLPEDFSDFAEAVFDFMGFYGFGEMLLPSVYGKEKPRKSEYIFCSVTFDEGCKSYYYLTKDDSVKIGDFVLVPVGKDKHEAVAKVVNMEYFSEENVPLPVEKTKRIICKCTDKDFPHPQSK